MKNKILWKEYSVGELGKIVTGNTPPKKNPEYYNSPDYPWIKPTDINKGERYVPITEEFYSEKAYNKYKSALLPAHATCVVTIGTVGEKMCLTSEPCFTNQSINAIIPDKEKFDPFFVFYLMRNNLDQVAHRNPGTASGRHHVSKSNFSGIIVRAPPKNIQEKIATILSTYDDLIENNNRRINILEEMAQALYREWFVEFRFPGHEDVRMVEVDGRMVPEGWEIVKFTDIIDVFSGGTPKTTNPDYWDGQIPFFTPKDAGNNFYIFKTEKTITKIGLEKCNSRLYPKETIFITARGTVGKILMPGTDMAMNQSCYALTGKEGFNQLFVFLLTLSYVENLKKNTGGATFDTIIIDTFRRMDIIKPENKLIELFFNSVQPIFRSIQNIMLRNQILTQTRDLLLPRLIEGEIDVSDLDISSPQE